MSKRAPPTESEVLVCHAGTCRRRGAEAVLAEIEELVGEMDGCTVRPSGCQGYCSEGPNAIVRARGRPPKVHVRLRSLGASARVAESATGRPAKLDEQASGRLGQLRAVRARQRATSLSLWNAALKGIAEEAETRPALRAELQSLLANAGFPNGIGPLLPTVADDASLDPQLLAVDIAGRDAGLDAQRHLPAGVGRPEARHAARARVGPPAGAEHVAHDDAREGRTERRGAAAVD